jgi:IS30 family transposase
VKPLPNIKRGRLTADEIEVLRTLAEQMRSPTPGKVARIMNRHPATIQWQMICAGLIRRERHYGPRPSYQRRGRTIFHFDAAEDRRLEELRVDGLSVAAIAEKLNAEFGRNRTGHSVDVRLKMLAAYAEPA